MKEHLSLGDKYLEELDYDQARLEYEAVISIDPKNVDAYLGLVEVYIRTLDFDAALEIAQKGYDETGDELLLDKIEALKEGNVRDSRGLIYKIVHYDADGNVIWWHQFMYGADKKETRIERCDPDGNVTSYLDLGYTEDSGHIDYSCYSSDGNISSIRVNYIDENYGTLRSVRYDTDWNLETSTAYEYNEDKTEARHIISRANSEGVEYVCEIWENSYGENWEKTAITYYSAEGEETPGGSQIIHYSIDDNKIKHRILYELFDANGICYEYTKYNYDESWNQLSQEVYDGDGTLKETIIVE